MRGLTYLAAAAAATTVLSLITLAAARPPAARHGARPFERRVKQTGNWAGYVAVAANPGIKMHFIAAEFRVPCAGRNWTVSADLGFHAACRYSLISLASLVRRWIWVGEAGRAMTPGASSGARRPMPSP